ncbi:hypothetical protein TVAG_349060 [Trichomonas vaginalis G3]|uniref:Uncharacterized protein n=1 Tax=Trichomonas vaginalis (strain ATCC PRA-98 / G3) TaxID=412133 RepID=A2G4H8_TRIV3|nr:hypothetical protein TVAG_349060 [Trichomonas vaginalis G3]|eukprot:XP_001300874.1 hypothetical protein [Trichomonas vaginalis G3]
MSNISDQITFVNWTGQISKPDIYRPIVTICSAEVQAYSITYKAFNPISHIDSRFLKAPFISEIFALLFLFFAVVGVLNWALHPQFLIPVLISNTLTSISAALLFTSYYIYYTKLPFQQEVSLGLRLICSLFLSLTVILSLITGHMTACGFSIISLDLHTKSAIINIITTLIMGVSLFILDLHISLAISLTAVFVATGGVYKNFRKSDT